MYLANINVIMVLISFVLLIVAAVAWVELRSIQKHVVMDCSDFTSDEKSKVMAYYKDGHPELDKNGDGIPCNELFK